ncbi:MAG TPA: hypothetical protein VLV83_21565, partial [Acidobacteriota bacterium]|nr:hypothetical protein [Acidobacteriota bacterium]
MPEESVGIDVNMVVDRAEAGMDRLGRKTNQATENVEKLEKRGGRAGRALNRAFNTGVRGVVGINRGILRTINFLASMRTLVLGVFGFLAGRLLLGLIQRFEELEKSQIRAIAALRAAQKRFGAQAGTIAGLIRFIRDLRSEYRTLSRIEINNAVAQTVELQRNFGLAADQQQVLARRIIDTAAATGRTVEDVTERIRSGFLGSTEAIEDLGVNFLKTRLSALAAAEGYGKNFTAL